MRQVASHLLWIGNAADGRAFRELFDLGVRAIVQLAFEEPPIHAPRELILLRIPLVDGAGNSRETLDLAIRSVAGLICSKTPTLVCCGAGMSRSPAVTAAAISLTERHAPAECLSRIAGLGPADVSAALWYDLLEVVEVRLKAGDFSKGV